MSGKKIVATIFVILIMCGGVAVPTKKASAIFGIGDLTVDVVQEHIKLILNPIAHALARQIVNGLVQSTVTWANSGFKGSPVFVQDPVAFLSNAVNGSAAGFLTGFNNGQFGFLCSPFQNQIKLSLINYYSKPQNQQFQCTWSGVAANMQSFVNG